MEFKYPSISIFFTFLLFILMLTKLLKKINSKSFVKKLPPGPRQLPLIGSLHHLVGSILHHRLRDLANKYGPLMFIQLGEIPTIVVSSAEIAEEVLKTHGIIFAERPNLITFNILCYNNLDILFSSYGDYWRQLRKICSMELLSSRSVQTFRSVREEEVLHLIDAISSYSPGSAINLSKLIFSLTYTITGRAAFGGSKDQEAFSSLISEIVKISAGFSIADMYPSVKFLHRISGFLPRVENMSQKLDVILENILAEHRERETKSKNKDGGSKEDLVDVLLRIQNHGNIDIALTDNSIKAVILDIFSAGSETTSTTVEWAMSEMLKNPRVMEKAQAEVRRVFVDGRNVDESKLDKLKYLQCVIKETLRLHPPAPLPLPRENSEQCEINGYVIPAKTQVIVNVWAIGRDPRYWDEAELFIPERFLNSSIDYKGTNFEYIPFGAGRRICPGMLFAIANMELPLAQLLYHFDWKLPNGSKQEELDMIEEFGITVRRKNDLHLIPTPYYHPSPCIE